MTEAVDLRFEAANGARDDDVPLTRDGQRPLSGWIILDKPLGLGSTQAVGAVKRALREAGLAKTKVGHGGTLDPLATGVLPVALGEATKLAGRMLDASKIYEFTVTFGVETDGLDAEGAAVATSDVRPTLADVERVLPRFTGPIQQVPPAFSAIKIDGKRAYDRARAGETVTMQARDVAVYRLEVIARPGSEPSRGMGEGAAGPMQYLQNDPTVSMNGEAFVTLRAHVSKGTYIRSLARDLAHALGSVGHVTMLRRIKAGPFGLPQAISLDILEKISRDRTLQDKILPLEAGLDDIPALFLDPASAGALRQGRVLTGIAASDGLHCAYDGVVPVALVEAETGALRVVRGFNL